MINIEDKKKCCGCSACAQRCPKHCIEMREDEEGFLYPCIDALNCINCGLCEKICPIINIDMNGEFFPKKTYAAYNQDESERLQSSSGGVFSLLSRLVINHGGRVFGAQFTTDWQVEHTCISSISELHKLRGAKYVQSRIGNTYSETEQFLKDNVSVLFSGTPCQIAGLRSYLRKEYDNLITAEIICHGVPSPKVWRTYLQDLCRKKNIHKINQICFRDKVTGWKHYSFSVKYNKKGKEKKISEYYTQNLYARGFTNDLYLRPSCHSCPFKSLRSRADFTLGDFWGIQHVDPKIDDDKGITALLVNTEKGLSFLKDLDIQAKEFGYRNVISGNPSLVRSTKLTEKRHLFYKEFNRDARKISGIISDLTRLPFILSLKIWLYYKLKNIVKK